MSGKYTKRNRKGASGRTGRGKPSAARKGLWIGILLALVALAAALCLLLFLMREDGALVPEETEPAGTAASESTESTEATIGTIPTEDAQQGQTGDWLFELERGVCILDISSYTGAFMEDSSDEVVSGVTAILVKNNGEEFIQYAEIRMTAGETEAVFTLSTLMPGESVWVLEQNRLPHGEVQEVDTAKLTQMAVFPEQPGMCEDRLEIQSLDGVINVTNISGEDIEGDIVIYYKNYIDGVYYGGITYRIRISGGLKAGEIRQGTAEHFLPSNSVVVFVTCG